MMLMSPHSSTDTRQDYAIVAVGGGGGAYGAVAATPPETSA